MKSVLKYVNIPTRIFHILNFSIFCDSFRHSSLAFATHSDKNVIFRLHPEKGGRKMKERMQFFYYLNYKYILRSFDILKMIHPNMCLQCEKRQVYSVSLSKLKTRLVYTSSMIFSTVKKTHASCGFGLVSRPSSSLLLIWFGTLFVSALGLINVNSSFSWILFLFLLVLLLNELQP